MAKQLLKRTLFGFAVVLVPLFLSLIVLRFSEARFGELIGSTYFGSRESAVASDSDLAVVFLGNDDTADDDGDGLVASILEYDYYRDSCPQAETIIRNTVKKLYSQQNNIAPRLLRLFFHDCFIKGCDASILVDDSNGNKSRENERQAVPNTTLKGFEEIALIKLELEKACPRVVSCADALALATRDSVLLAGAPYYPILTGRRDSNESYFDDATTNIPKPTQNVSETLRLFALRGFTERETVSLLGAHNIGRIACQFVDARMSNFTETGVPDSDIATDLLDEFVIRCADNSTDKTIPLGAGFDNHYYANLLARRGVLFADQQLMADDTTAVLVQEFASDDGSTFKKEFARAMVKMSILGVLTKNQGQVRENCTLPLNQD